MKYLQFVQQSTSSNTDKCDNAIQMTLLLLGQLCSTTCILKAVVNTNRLRNSMVSQDMITDWQTEQCLFNSWTLATSLFSNSGKKGGGNLPNFALAGARHFPATMPSENISWNAKFLWCFLQTHSISYCIQCLSKNSFAMTCLVCLLLVWVHCLKLS